MVKVIALLKRKDNLTQEEFSRYWWQKHGVLVAKTVPGLKRVRTEPRYEIAWGERAIL